MTEERAAAGKLEPTTGPPVAVCVAQDRLAVFAWVDLNRMDPLQAGDEVAQQLEKLKIQSEQTVEEIAAALQERADTDGLVKGASIVVGTEPVPGVNGRVEWADDFFNEGFAIDERTGAMDFRTRLGKPYVDEGQLLANVIPPVPGQDGVDVFGRRIPAKKPSPAHIRAGENVRLDEAATSLYAKCAGRVRYDTDGTLIVDNVLRIRGSVGLATGNIVHPGAILVDEDIEAGSTVEATGDIEVLGSVEAANVTAGGKLVVRCGITGSPQVMIRARSVHARFIADATIYTQEDVNAEREIIHSTIRARGAVLVPRGRLVGGEAIALGGIDVNQAGSEGAVKTLLVAGKDLASSQRIAERENRGAAIRENLKTIRARIFPYGGPNTVLTPVQREALHKLEAKVRELEAALATIEKEIAEIKADVEARAKHQVTVRGNLYPEAMMSIKNAMMHVKLAIRGPLRAAVVRGEIELLAL